MPDLRTEYDWVLKGVGLFDLPHAVLRFEGSDIREFLQGALSNDIKKLKKGRGLAACHLDAKGHLIASLKLFEEDEGIWTLTSPAEAVNLQNGMKKLIFFSQTELKDLSSDYGWILVIGEKADSFISDFFQIKIDLPSLSHEKGKWEGAEVKVVRDSDWEYPAFLLLAQKSKIQPLLASLMEGKRDFPVDRIGKETYEVLRIESGIPAYGVDMNEKNLPPEVLPEDDYISYTKGCYVGQEVISRIKHRGHVNKRLVRLKLERRSPIGAGHSVFLDEKEVGLLTHSAYSPRWETVLGLSTVRLDAAEPGKNLTVKTPEGDVGAVVL